MGENPIRHAVVTGASMAGLLAARVLADHFDHVTVIERDTLPRQPEPRKGVPQGRHVHVLLVRGQTILEVLFPGLTNELRGAGALTIDAGRELAWYHAGDWRKHFDTDLRFLALSRPLLEGHIAGRVRALPNVTLLEGTRVDGIKTDSNGTVRGVSVGGQGQGKTLEGDLVIDATGRGSITPQWLEQLGYDAVTTHHIPARVTYSTCLFRRAEQGPDWRALMVTNPGAKRTGFAYAIEGDRWLVTLASFFDEPVPQDHAAFLRAAKSLPTLELYEAIRDLLPITGVWRYRFAGSQRRRYERLRSFPQGLIVIGDAVASFNPVYGQGMTVAALEAEALARLVTEAKARGGMDRRLARRWFHHTSSLVDTAWQGVAAEDFRLPEMSAGRPVSLIPVQWYMDRVHRATHRSAAVTERFYRVITFLDPPAALFRPRIVAKVLFGSRS